jgi:hypothetical protein
LGRGISGTFYRAEIYRGRLFFRAEIYKRRLFFRADRSLGAKQEGLTIVHLLNKLIVLQYTYIVGKMRFICARCETARQMLVFLHVPKAHTHELYIFQQYTHSRKTFDPLISTQNYMVVG